MTKLAWAAALLLAQTVGEKTGHKPLSEMTAKDSHKGEDGGLYGGGSNEPPKAHAEAAKSEAARIQPLDGEGKPAAGGRIVLVSIGMSNTTQEFSRFVQASGVRRGGTLAIVDGAQGGQAAAQWNTPEARAWGEVDRRLQAAGVTPKQVQAAWIKQALIQQGQFGEFPKHAKKLQEELGNIVRIAKQKFPNLRIAYLSSRIYAGYAKSNLNPEPYAYEGAFSMRWLIQAQIAGDAELSWKDAKAPLLLWGPYLWGDGTTPRKADGLVWKEADLARDGTHPSESGRDKVAQLLLGFFKAEPTAKGWFAP
jgi:lysophospholipase L1-like esterase